MQLYTMSELLQEIKNDIGVHDIALPVDDNQLMQRICNSALKEFSVRSPFIHHILVNDNERIDQKEEDSYAPFGLKYRIPKYVYDSSMILSIPRVDVKRPMGYNDMYIPQGNWAFPDQVLSALADVRIAAAVGATMGRAFTWSFQPPDICVIYNGWAGGTYDVTLALMHDKSLSTIPPTAMTHFKQLCVLDIEQYLYNRLKRIQDLDLGVGTINLKIDDWQDAGQKKEELLKDWDDNGANLDIDSINWF